MKELKLDFQPAIEPRYLESWFLPRDSHQVENRFRELLDREIRDESGAEWWLADWQELAASIAEYQNKYHILFKVDTGDAESRKMYEFMCQEIIPIMKSQGNRLISRVLNEEILCRVALRLAPQWYRKIESDAEIFDERNIELEVQETKQVNRYNSIRGSMTAEWQGAPQTLVRMKEVVKDLDRETRESAWKQVSKSQKDQSEVLDEVFTKMLQLRNEMARNSGFENTRDYYFAKKHRFDYAPKECERFHEYLGRYFGEVYEESLAKVKSRHGLKEIRPWDMSLDMTGEAPSLPFADISILVNGVQSTMDRFDPQFAMFFKEMVEGQTLDLENRKGKAPGGFHTTLQRSRRSFIYMNSVGAPGNARTLFHEAGHAFHSQLAKKIDMFSSHPGHEYAEVASMSMELMPSHLYAEVFGADIGGKVTQTILGGIAGIMVNVAIIDSFQHWLYSNSESIDPEARHAKWLELQQKYKPGVNFEGYESDVKIGWQAILHIFNYPFYYIEYGIAQIGALQFWADYIEDPLSTLERYKKSLSAGGTLGPKRLFELGGIEWSLNESAVEKAAGILRVGIHESFGD